MDFLTFLSKVIDSLAWPILIIAIIFIFKKSISKLIEGLKKADIKSGKLEFDAGQIQNQKTLETDSLNIPIPTDKIGMQKKFEDNVRRDIDLMTFSDQAEKENMLISHLASTQLDAAYERTNNSIFGSQIELLKSLNSVSKPAKLGSLEVFYISAKKKYPDYYKNYSFDIYLKYLLDMRLIEHTVEGYNISLFGIGYLVYIAEKGLTGFRHY